MAEHHDDAQPTASGMTLGSKLREARLNQGLSTEQVAERLNLRRAVIENLESDHFDTGVSPTFTKGYVKQYAKLMGLELEPLLKQFDDVVGISEAKLNSFSRRTMREATDHRWVYVTYLVATVIVASVVVWWFQQSDFGFTQTLDDMSQQVESLTESKGTVEDLSAMIESNSATSQPDELVDEERPSASQSSEVTDVENGVFNDSPRNAIVVESQNANQQTTQSDNDDEIVREAVQADALLPVQDLANPEPTAEQSPLLETSTDTNADSLARSEASNEQSDDSTRDEVGELTDDDSSSQQNSTASVENFGNSDAASGEKIVLDAEGMVTVDMELLDDCWMSVRDADNRTLAYGVKKGGRTIQVVGKPPISFRIGAPQNIVISVGQVAVDLSGYNDGEIAKFEFPEVAQ